MGIDTKYINQFINVTSRAALASYYFVGKNDKIKAGETIIELASVYKRLKEFEAKINEQYSKEEKI